MQSTLIEAIYFFGRVRGSTMSAKWYSDPDQISLCLLFGSGSVNCSCLFLVSIIINYPGEKNIDEAINTLDKESVDVLMKYIYRLFEAPQEKNYALVLTWRWCGFYFS